MDHDRDRFKEAREAEVRRRRFHALLDHRDRHPLAVPGQQPPGEFGLRQMINNRGRGRVHYRLHGDRPFPLRGGPLAAHRKRTEPCVERIKVDEDVLCYSGSAGDPPGSYSDTHTIDHHGNYFEIEILDVGDCGQISVGLVQDKVSLNTQPGVINISAGYMADNGAISFMGYECHSGPPCGTGDRMGVGFRVATEVGGGDQRGDRQASTVFFTKNGREVKSLEMVWSPGLPLYPAVGMQSEGEEVLLCLDATFDPDGVTQMVVDCGEEDWMRLDDVRLNGTVLEYAGRGRAIHDVGLAQAKHALDTTSHYFEFEIVDPGEGCYVAIGLAKKNYPMRRHPGWNQGSIAYHADDGKLFHGSGLGVRFGPKCCLGDVMGCGIYFPPDYDSEAEVNSNDEEEDLYRGEDEEEDEDIDEDRMDKLLGIPDSDDEEDLLDAFFRPQKGRLGSRAKGTKVTVFFTRNGKLVGHRDVRIPKGGFYPTVGMLSLNEKVKVDLRPLTG